MVSPLCGRARICDVRSARRGAQRSRSSRDRSGGRGSVRAGVAASRRGAGGPGRPGARASGCGTVLRGFHIAVRRYPGSDGEYGDPAESRRARDRARRRSCHRLPTPAANRRSLGSRRAGGARNGLFGARFAWVLRGLGVARVEPQLEERAEILAGREHVLVPWPAGRQLHDPHVVFAAAVAALVRRRLIERRQRSTTAEKAHTYGISRIGRRRKPLRPHFAGSPRTKTRLSGDSRRSCGTRTRT